MSTPIAANHNDGSGDGTFLVRWNLVLMLMAISFTNWFNRMSLTVADRAVEEELGLTSFQIGLIDSALLLVYTVCMTPGGWLIDRIGPKRALMILGFGTGLFVALTGHVDRVVPALMALYPLMLARTLVGACSAPMYPGSGKMVSNWIPLNSRALANGLITGAAPIGMACSHIIFGYLIDTYTWRNAFVITGSATFLLALIWWALASDSARGNGLPTGPGYADPRRKLSGAALDSRVNMARRAKVDWKALLCNRSLILLTLSYAAVGYFQYLFNFCSEYYFKGVLAIPEEISRQYSAYTNIAQAAAMPVGGLLTDILVRNLGLRWGRALVPMAAMTLSSVSLFASTYTTDADITLGWFLLANAAIGAVEGAFWTTAIELGGPWGGTSGAIVNTGGNLGGTPAPAVTRGLGQLFEGDWRPGFFLGTGVCFIGVLLWFWIDARQRVETAGPEGYNERDSSAQD